jgi:hypothetical protein
LKWERELRQSESRRDFARNQLRDLFLEQRLNAGASKSFQPKNTERFRTWKPTLHNSKSKLKH